MANPALGRKYACHNCGTKFYDLNKPDAKCPKCGAPPEVQSSEAAPKASRGGSKRGRVAPVYEPKVEEDDAPFDDEDAAPAFDDDDAPFDDDDAAFEDEEGGDEEEGGGEDEEG